MPSKLHTIVVSTRPSRKGPKIAEWFHAAAVRHDKFDCALVDLADFALPVFDEPEHPRKGDYRHRHTRRWAESVAAADAFAFVTPEYNHAAPPSLVNALTFLVREWEYKPVGLVSYGGQSGGLRSAQSVKPLLTTLKMMPIPEGVAIPAFSQHMTEDGSFEPAESIGMAVAPMLDELFRWAGALRVLRAPA